MATLTTVQNYLDKARELLQDEETDYRYSDADIVEALNEGLLEARRLRPELFLDVDFVVPSYSEGSLSDTVVFDEQYRMSLVYYVVGMMHLRDEEEANDQRAVALTGKFIGQLQGTGI